ncbi:MAG: hypothetical protein ABSA49_04425 [Rhizomicrobium sp.]
MRIRALMGVVALFATVCGIAQADTTAPARDLIALFAPTQFGQQDGANVFDSLTPGTVVDFGSNFDSVGRLDPIDVSSSDSLLLPSSAWSAPYAALTSSGSYSGSTIALGDGLRVRFGEATLTAQNLDLDVPAFADLAQLDGPQQFDLRSARTSMVGTDWDFASWGGLGIVASQTSEQNGALGSGDSDGFAIAKSAANTTVGTSARVGFGEGWVTTVTYSEGVTNLDLRSNSLAPASDTLHDSSYSFAIAKQNVFGGDSIDFAVIRPLQVYSSDFGFPSVDGLGTGANMIFSHGRESLLGQAPQTDLEVGYVTSFFNGALALQANAGYQMNLAGQNGTNSLSVISRAKINF